MSSSEIDHYRQRLNEAPLEPINVNIFEYEEKVEDQTSLGVTDEKAKASEIK